MRTSARYRLCSWSASKSIEKLYWLGNALLPSSLVSRLSSTVSCNQSSIYLENILGETSDGAATAAEGDFIIDLEAAIVEKKDSAAFYEDWAMYPDALPNMLGYRKFEIHISNKECLYITRDYGLVKQTISHFLPSRLFGKTRLESFMIVVAEKIVDRMAEQMRTLALRDMTPAMAGMLHFLCSHELATTGAKFACELKDGTISRPMRMLC